MEANLLVKNESLLWFYSSLAQVFAALLGLVGVFVVYRLQDQRNKIKDSCDNSRTVLMRAGLGRDTVDRIPDQNMIEQLDHWIQRLDNTESKKELQQARDLIILRRRGEVWVKNRIKLPLILMSVMLVASISLLPLHIFISDSCTQYLIFSIMLSLAVITVLTVSITIYRLVYGQQNAEYRTQSG